jgi:hypothetical protein
MKDNTTAANAHKNPIAKSTTAIVLLNANGKDEQIITTPKNHNKFERFLPIALFSHTRPKLD